MQNEQQRIQRRNFLIAASAAAGGLLVGGCEQKEDPYALGKQPISNSYGRGEEDFIATACGQCAAGCSIRVRRVEGRAVKCEGNLACPINSGGIGPRGQASLQVMHDPDRIHQPMQRVGPRGTADFKPISWDEAIGILSEHLQTLRANNAAHRAAIICGRERGMMFDLWQRFAQSYGTPNFFDGFSHGNAAMAQAFDLLTGNREMPAYDWQNARYVLSLDSNVMESSCQSVYFTRSQALLRRGNTHTRAKIVHVGQAFTRTGINADQVVLIKPGTIDSFALGLCRILVQKNLYDKNYIAEHCLGFEPWKDAEGVEHRGFRDSLDRYTPEHIEARCGVAEKVLVKIAYDMAEARPSFAITGAEAMLATNGLQAAWATLALNTLLGSIHRPGGLLIQKEPPMPAWDAVKPDEFAQAGLQQPRLDGVGHGAFPLATSVIEALPDALISGIPYTLDTLLLYYANPLYSKINPARWTAALRKVPFIVSFSPFMDETATEVADLILPDHTFLERWEDAAQTPATGYAVFGIRQPVIDKPVHNTMPTGDVVLQVAKKLGGSIAADLPFKDFKDGMMRRVIGLYKARRGSIVNKNGGKFLQELYQTGFWTDDAYDYGDWKTVLRTSSGKIELFSLKLQKKLLDLAAADGRPIEKMLTEMEIYGDLDYACMPHERLNLWYGDSRDYPLVLVPYKPNTYAVGSGANLPLLQELPLFKGRPVWTTEAQVHPETAARYGIQTGDTIEIESPMATIQVPVVLSAGIHPGMIRVPQGGGHTAFGKAAIGRGANVMRLLAPHALDHISGISPVVGTRVRIRKATV